MPPKGTLVWSNAPTAGQPVQSNQTPVPPSGSLQWTSSPTYSPDDIFDVPEVTTSFADRARTALGYDANIKRQQDIAERYIAGKSSTPEMVAQSAMNTAGAVVAPVIKGLGKVLQGADYLLSGKGAYNPIPEKNLYTDIRGGVKEKTGKLESAISDIPSVQKYAQSDASQSFEEYLRGANDLFVFTPLPKIVAGSNKVLTAAEEYAIQQANKLKETRADSSLQTVMNQIRQTEKVGAGAKTAETAKDALVLQRIAQSNVLPKTVDKTGTVDATAIKEAQRQYLEQPIGRQEDGTPITVRNAESVVERLLVQEGAKVNINQVVNSLRTAVEQSGLAADIMQRALNVGVPKFAQALMKYADEFGNIALNNLHTEKIRTTANLDYGKPASAIYRKSLASGLRQIIEDTSKHPIHAINQELGLHLEAVKRIGKLAGKKVEGGRLGGHVARGVGTGLGIVLGSVAGPIGGAVGGAVGGGVGKAVQSAKMQRTFGKAGESTMPPSQTLEKASIEASKPVERDLTVPDKAKGAGPNIPKTKEILRLEKEIKDNVQAQKRAIKAKDFELVEKLKEIYDMLVAKLKDAIQKAKNTPNKQGGFAKNPFSENPPKSPTTSGQSKSARIPSPDDTTQSLEAQARNYKTPEEFVKAIDNRGDHSFYDPAVGLETKTGKPILFKAYHGTNKQFDKFIIPKDGVRYTGDGVYFTPSKASASAHGSRVIESYLDLKNPYVMDISGKSIDFQPGAERIREIQGAGHDSIIVRTGGGGGESSIINEVVVFDTSAIKTKFQLTDIWKQAHDNASHLAKAQQALREAKGLSASDIMAKYPDINLKRDVTVTDIHGKKSVIPEGEALTPYELKGNKVLLQDGETYIVSKNQWQNVKGQSVSGEAKEFAPELAGTEEVVKGAKDYAQAVNLGEEGAYESLPPKIRKILGKYEDFEGDYAMNNKMIAELKKEGWTADYGLSGEIEGLSKISEGTPTKYSSYTLPGGENYKEILVKAPVKVAEGKSKTLDALNKIAEEKFGRSYVDLMNEQSVQASGMRQDTRAIYMSRESARGRRITDDTEIINQLKADKVDFRSSHWDEPNVLSHLRMNERIYNGKKVAFSEEFQSDANIELRKIGKDEFIKKYGEDFYNKVKLHLEMSVKRALKEAVDSNAEYFAWINGEQTSARYNLATHVDDVRWSNRKASWWQDDAVRNIEIHPKGQGDIIFQIDKEGKILNDVGQGWKGKKLDEVLGKGLADKIMEKESGTLSGEGLKFGGEWAHNLYDKQVGDIVRKVTGGKVENLDMGLPVDNKSTRFEIPKDHTLATSFEPLTPEKLKVGLEIRNDQASARYIITDILGDGKFKAVPKDNVTYATPSRIKKELTKKGSGGQPITINDLKIGDEVLDWQHGSPVPFTVFAKDSGNVMLIKGELAQTFDISTKTTTQQGIRLTEEIKRLIRGEAPELKKPSGKSPL